MRSMKKIISIFLVLTVIFAMIPVNVSANSEISKNSKTETQSQNESDNANKNAAQVHKGKAEELLFGQELKTNNKLISAQYTKKIEQAYELYKEGCSYEAEGDYKKAKDAFQSSWQLLKKYRDEIHEINNKLEALINNPNDDYDHDKLLNIFELNMFDGLINPMAYDSDNNGISDADEDYDNDTLTNLEEQQLGTNPIMQDTDGDGLRDDSEVRLGSNPCQADSDLDGIPDNQELYRQNIDSSETGVKLEILSSHDLFDCVDIIEVETVMSSVYSASPFYEILTDLPFDTAEISIPVDLDKIPDNEVQNVRMFYFDEEIRTFIPLEDQTVDVENNIVRGKTNHFSLYTLFYIPNWNSIWSVPFNKGERTTEEVVTYLDVMFIIDSSGSMTSNDPYGYRKTAAKRFVDALLPGSRAGLVMGDRAGVVDFDSYAKLLQPLTEDFESVKTAIDSIDSSGGTDIGAGVSLANNELIIKSTNDRLKVEILLTDGQGSYSSAYTNEVVNNNIVIYTIWPWKWCKLFSSSANSRKYRRTIFPCSKC